MDIDFDVRLENLTIGDIKIDETQLSKIEDKIFDIQSVVKQKVFQEIKPLQEVALNYIAQMNNAFIDFKKLIIKYNKQLSIITKIENDSILAKNYAEAKISQPSTEKVLELQSKLIKITDDFTIKLFNILGKKLQLIYVYQSKAANKVEIYKIKKIEDLLKIRKTSHGGIETRLKASKKDLENQAILLKKEQYYGGLAQAEKLDNMYREIIRRYNTYRY